jgi:hypothetical protein
MKHEIAINRSLLKRNPLIYPSDPIAPTAPPECEAYALGHDARNDFRPLDENPYDGILECVEYVDWAQGWADADRELDEDEVEGD